MDSMARIPANFAKDLNEFLLLTILNAPTSVCEKTAFRWMKFLGFYPKGYTKGYFVDGHERDDVVAHRTRFLKDMESLEARTAEWSGDNMEICKMDYAMKKYTGHRRVPEIRDYCVRDL
jgi:hypothetical protein